MMDDIFYRDNRLDLLKYSLLLKLLSLLLLVFIILSQAEVDGSCSISQLKSDEVKHPFATLLLMCEFSFSKRREDICLEHGSSFET